MKFFLYRSQSDNIIQREKGTKKSTKFSLEKKKILRWLLSRFEEFWKKLNSNWLSNS